MFFPCVIKKLRVLSFRKHHTKNPKKTGGGHLSSSCWKFGLDGSVTVEACLVFPVFLFAVLALLFIMPLMKNQEEIQVSVLETGKWASAREYFYGTLDLNLELTESLVLQEKVKSNISEDGFWENCVAGGISGLAGLDSVMGEDIYLAVHHAVDMPVDVSNIYLRIGTQKAKTRGFVGDTGFPSETDAAGGGYSGDGSEIVYVTAYGQVWHKSRECSHLNLTIADCDGEEISTKRNRYGACYYACDKCEVIGPQVYYTPEGNRYHGSASCSGLKRTILEVPESEVSGLRYCSKCGG